MYMETNIFGNRLRILLEEKDLEGKEFAKIIHVQPPTVSNWLNGNRFPNQDTLRKIADYFNVSLDYLMGFSDIKNPSKSNELIEYVIEEAEKHGYNLRNKSKEEIAKIIVKALKIDEISKSN